MREPYRVEAEQLYPQPEINGLGANFTNFGKRADPHIRLALAHRTNEMVLPCEQMDD